MDKENKEKVPENQNKFTDVEMSCWNATNREVVDSIDPETIKTEANAIRYEQDQNKQEIVNVIPSYTRKKYSVRGYLQYVQ